MRCTDENHDCDSVNLLEQTLLADGVAKQPLRESKHKGCVTRVARLGMSGQYEVSYMAAMKIPVGNFLITICWYADYPYSVHLGSG